METRHIKPSEYRAPIIISPGDILKDFLDDFSMTQIDLSYRIGISKSHINQVIKGSKPLTQEVAQKLSTVFNTTSQFWMKLEISYRSRLSEVEDMIFTKEEEDILREMPYAELAKRGHVDNTKKPLEKISEMRRFFMVSELTRVKNTYPAFRKSATKLDHTYSLLAWQRIGEIKSKSMSADSLNLSKLNSAIKKIREFTTLDPKIGFEKTVSILRGIGVVVVLEKHFPGSGTNGMVFFTPKKNRVIVLLSVRNKYADTFWFTLFHELAHLVLHHEENIPLNNLEDEVENRVNEIAKDMLIPKDKYLEFIEENDFSIAGIKQFSEAIKIHHCIVIGRLQYDGVLDHKNMNSLRPQLEIVQSNEC